MLTLTLASEDEQGPQGDSDSTSDDGSETSTIVYSHEPFETYNSKVAILISDLYSHANPPQLQIRRLAGGGFNRIIGISISPPLSGTSGDNSQCQEFILRVPRFEVADVAMQTLTITHIKKSTSLPIPEIVHYDGGIKNPLGEPYILMKKLRGQSLHTVFDTLTHAEKLSMARTIAQTIAQIHSVSVPKRYGPLCANDRGISAGKYTIGGEHEHPGASYTLPATLENYLAARFSELVRANLKDSFVRTVYEKLRDVGTQFLKQLPARSSYRYVLRHPDFAARNILVENIPERDAWLITGVLDWDDCEVAPSEIAFACPVWVWLHPDQDSVPDSFDESDWDPDYPVYNDECQEVKDAFVDEVEKLLPGFMDVIRETRKLPLKKLWRLARSGIHSNEDYRMATFITDFETSRCS